MRRDKNWNISSYSLPSSSRCCHELSITWENNGQHYKLLKYVKFSCSWYFPYWHFKASLFPSPSKTLRIPNNLHRLCYLLEMLPSNRSMSLPRPPFPVISGCVGRSGGGGSLQFLPSLEKYFPFFLFCRIQSDFRLTFNWHATPSPAVHFTSTLFFHFKQL